MTMTSYVAASGQPCEPVLATCTAPRHKLLQVAAVASQLLAGSRGLPRQLVVARTTRSGDNA